jgi:hypothetical protein
MQYVIKQINDNLYWSIEDGWTDQDGTIFSEEEMRTLRLPIDGKWMPLTGIAIVDVYGDGEELVVVQDDPNLDESLCRWHANDFAYDVGKIDESDHWYLTDWLVEAGFDVKYARRIYI